MVMSNEHHPQHHLEADAAAPHPDVAQFLRWFKAQRRAAPGTVINYQRDLGRLAAACSTQDLHTLDMHRIRSAVARLHAQGLQAKSIAHALSAWRAFFSWMCREGRMTHNPALGVRAPKSAKTLPKALSTDDAVALAEFVPDDSPVSLRDHAMVELLYSSGLRRAELVSLDVQYVKNAEHESKSWLDIAAAEVQVIGKGSKRRVVPVGGKALAALQAWLVVRPQFLRAGSSADARAALFLGARGERINGATVHTRLARLSVQAGVPAKVHPHVLRHSAASHLLQSSGDLRAVQEFLGHANIATTQIYTKLDWQHLAKAYDAAHPRAKKKA
jgi:integrase/recombinase XerC